MTKDGFIQPESLPQNKATIVPLACCMESCKGQYDVFL